MNVDEIWIHHYIPGLFKQQSKQWTKTNGRASKKEEDSFIGWKGDGHGFWDSQRISMTDLLEKDKTITGAYCVVLMNRSKDKLKKKRQKSDFLL